MSIHYYWQRQDQSDYLNFIYRRVFQVVSNRLRLIFFFKAVCLKNVVSDAAYELCPIPSFYYFCLLPILPKLFLAPPPFLKKVGHWFFRIFCLQ